MLRVHSFAVCKWWKPNHIFEAIEDSYQIECFTHNTYADRITERGSTERARRIEGDFQQKQQQNTIAKNGREKNKKHHDANDKDLINVLQW